MTHKVLISTIKFRGYEEQARQALERRGCELISYEIQRRPISPDLLLQLAPEAAGLVAGPEKITAAVMDAAPNLRVICAPGVGYDHIDVAAATSRKIVVTTCAGANHHAVAEMALGMMLGLARRLCWTDGQMRQGQWPSVVGTELWGKTVGIVGLGAIGKGLALRARAMGMRVLAMDSVRDIAFATQNSISYVSLAALLRESDFVSLHCPLTPETRGLISANTIALMKPTAYVINTARGPLVNSNDLLAALQEGRLAGAGLDVFEQEPLANSPLAGCDKIILTPHAAGATIEAIEASLDIALENIVSVLSGRAPVHRIN